MRLAAILALCALASAFAVAPSAHATGFCTDATSSTCTALLCVREPGSGAWVCSNQLVVCVKDDCPGLP